MASEIGLLSRRLLTSCSIRSRYVQASQQIFRQPLWAQPRTFASSAVLYNSPPSDVQKPANGGPSRPAIVAQAPPPPPPSSTAAAPAQKKSGNNFSYDATADAFDISKIISLENDEFLQKHYPTSKQEPELRTRPATGRTVHIHGNVDFSRSIKKLARYTKLNMTKRIWHSQKFHERPGMKRKRLKGERHKKRFMDGFKAAVQRVQELKNQGW